MSLRRFSALQTKLYPVCSRYILPVSGCSCVNTQSVRWMAQTRKKAPAQAKEKTKFVSRVARQAAKKPTKRVMPNNWDKVLQRKIEDDFYIKNYYPPVKYSIIDMIDMHREINTPEMLDNMDGFLYLNAELNMLTSKKTKFILEFEGVLNLPHYFDDGTENKVLAFCKTKEEQKLALEAGAVFAGGQELVALIESGDVRSYMFDHAVCTLDILDNITKARKHIRDKFPNKRTGAIGTDISTLVNHYRYGKNYKCTKPYDEIGVLKVNIGPLNMPTEHLVDNFNAFVQQINSHRPTKAGAVGGPFMTKAYCTVPPSGEKVYVKEEHVVGDEKSKQSKQLAPAEIDDEDDDEDADQAAATTVN